jgi:hypothetical protein
LTKKPQDFEELIERVGFYWSIPRHFILYEMDMEELIRYAKKGAYYLAESRGKKMKSISSFQSAEYEKERRERLKKVYGEV